MKTPYFIGITGGSGAGKTQILQWLKNSCEPEQICLVSQDDYYDNNKTYTREENKLKNFDEPDIFDVKQFAADLQKLKEGQIVTRQEYSFNNPAHVPKMLEFHPAPVILVEGIFVFHFPEISQLLDLKIFVDAKEHLKFHRRIARDQRERGFSLEDILFKYTNQVAPAFEKYIEPYRHEADFIVPNNIAYQPHETPAAIEVLVAFLKSKII